MEKIITTVAVIGLTLTTPTAPTSIGPSDIPRAQFETQEDCRKVLDYIKEQGVYHLECKPNAS